MSIGSNIKAIREEQKLTQERVAEAVGVSFQAVSSWERDEYKPDTDKLIKLAELFDVSVSAIAEEKHSSFRTKETIYNWEHMKTYVKTTAKALELKNTLKAVDYAVTNGWVRSGVLQGVLRCGFAQASRIVEKMRSLKFISDTACSKGYRCLINQSEWEKEREALLRKTQSSLASRLE